jgi:hypothetical protein
MSEKVEIKRAYGQRRPGDINEKTPIFNEGLTTIINISKNTKKSRKNLTFFKFTVAKPPKKVALYF